MSTKAGVDEPPGGASPGMKAQWNWHPVLPIPNSPLFEWPPSPVATFRWFAKSWLRLSMTLLVLGASTLTWIILQPALERTGTFEFGWIAQILLRNLALTVVIAGSLHLYLHTFRKQDRHHRFMKPGTERKHRKFTWGDQVLDNMFWTLASGVPIWSAYEVFYLWAYANGHLPTLDWAGEPALLALLFLLTPLWLSFHFYWIHRLLHWRPLYRMAHSLHHRNIDTGPWTGISMHPLEHVLYFSSILIHLVVPSHPLLMLFHMQLQALNPLASHSGFSDLQVRDRSWLALGEFHHQLHHRHFDCNYGTADVPLDKWFGSFHDGTPEATEDLRTRRLGRIKARVLAERAQPRAGESSAREP